MSVYPSISCVRAPFIDMGTLFEMLSKITRTFFILIAVYVGVDLKLCSRLSIYFLHFHCFCVVSRVPLSPSKSLGSIIFSDCQSRRFVDCIKIWAAWIAGRHNTFYDYNLDVNCIYKPQLLQYI